MSKAIFTLIIGLVVSSSLFANEISIIPEPTKVEKKSGEFLLTPKTQIVLNSHERLAVNVGEYLSALLEKPFGAKAEMEIIESPKAVKNAILLSLTDEKELGSEGYRLSVKKNGIAIYAVSAAGLFYGVQTLRQLLPPEIESGEIVRGGTLSVP